MATELQRRWSAHTQPLPVYLALSASNRTARMDPQSMTMLSGIAWYSVSSLVLYLP